MFKVMVVFGTRPEAIKMAPVVLELAKYRDRLKTVVCVTGQHRQMLDSVLSLFQIRPHYDLDIMEEGQSLSRLTTRVVAKFGPVIAREKPQLVLVQGDTTSAMLVSLVSFYHQISVGHVEAGLRTGDRYSPFPEEINRRLITTLATYHFAPTMRAMEALLQEGVPPKAIYFTGNTVIDALHTITESAYVPSSPIPLEMGAKLLLVTAHRRENWGRPLENICYALKELVRRNPEVVVLYPVHPNPKVREPVHRLLGGEERIHLVSPLPYEEFVYWMSRSYLILTDSGGIQEEAPVLGKPVLVLRRETERPEAVTAGTAKVVGTETADIVVQAEVLLHHEEEYNKMAQGISPFGDGRAAERIVDLILRLAEGRE